MYLLAENYKSARIDAKSSKNGAPDKNSGREKIGPDSSQSRPDVQRRTEPRASPETPRELFLLPTYP